MKCKDNEVRIGIRSGAASDTKTHGSRPMKVAVVVGGSRPMLWLGGAGEYEGLAWISGRGTLRRLRDALTEALDDAPDSTGVTGDE